MDLKDFLLEQAYSFTGRNIQYMYKNILIATSLIIMNSHEQQSQFYSLNLKIVLRLFELSDIRNNRYTELKITIVSAALL